MFSRASVAQQKLHRPSRGHEKNRRRDARVRDGDVEREVLDSRAGKYLVDSVVVRGVVRLDVRDTRGLRFCCHIVAVDTDDECDRDENAAILMAAC